MKEIRTVVVFFALQCIGACRGPTVGLAPDLSFWVDCPRLSEADQSKLEQTLYSSGFDVLNQSRLAHQLRLDYPPPVDIDAVDQRGFLFHMTVPNDAPKASSDVVSADVALYSPPPTRHDSKMEAAILMMTTKNLGCSARQLEHHDNGSAASKIFRTVARQYRGWLDQAKVAAPGSDALHLH